MIPRFLKLNPVLVALGRRGWTVRRKADGFTAYVGDPKRPELETPPYGTWQLVLEAAIELENQQQNKTHRQNETLRR